MNDTIDNGWNFCQSATNEVTLKPPCIEAEKHFSLSDRRLYRYFAVTDDEDLRKMNGQHYRGFSLPVKDVNCLEESKRLPKYLSDCVLHPFRASRGFVTWDEMVAFDYMIYIRDSTCLNVTGCVLTYAHELQHVTQHCRTPRLAKVNQVICDNLKTWEPAAIMSDVPHEREANIVSKRVAEAVCGAAVVRAFAEEQIEFMENAGEPEQKARWIFLRDVPSSAEFDLLQATIPLVQKYKGLVNFGIDVDKPERWLDPIEH